LFITAINCSNEQPEVGPACATVYQQRLRPLLLAGPVPTCNSLKLLKPALGGYAHTVDKADQLLWVKQCNSLIIHILSGLFRSCTECPPNVQAWQPRNCSSRRPGIERRY
jgi:hypothetical protein